MNKLPLDKHGYLANWEDWNESVADYFAQEEQIELTDAHWQVLHFVRNFYQQYDLMPANRILVKELQKQYGAPFTSTYLQSLFPKSPMRQIARLAGLPRPVRCI